MMQPRIFGFTLIRNGLKYDYPFRESLRSLGALCESITLALGDSEDQTEEAVRALGLPMRVLTTTWDENLRKSGVILSQQTGIALDALKKEQMSSDASVWGIYLQGDEVIHEDDYQKIREDIQAADKRGCSAVRFRYLHFWLTYQSLAFEKRWYPQEIRAVRLTPEVESYGDAQSFRNVGEIFESDARIFHYGHVREASAYERKKKDFHRWWHSDEEIQEVLLRGEKTDRAETTLRYLGPHPAVMEERMGGFNYPELSEVNLIGSRSNYSPEMVSKIRVKKAHWVTSSKEIERGAQTPTVLLDGGSLLDRMRYRSKVPSKMRSSIARPWPPEMIATLKLSERGICVGQGHYSPDESC